MTLRDNSAPTATNVGGDLIANPQWRGPMPLALQRDRHRLGRLPGHRRRRRSGRGSARSSTPTAGTAPTPTPRTPTRTSSLWAGAVPAPASPRRWPSTPARLPLGVHAVSIAVEDAAGNRTPIYGPVAKTIVGPARRPRRAQRQRRPATPRASPVAAIARSRRSFRAPPAARPRAPRRPRRQAHRRRADRRALPAAPRRRAHARRRLDAHEPQGRLQLQGAAGGVADAALRLSLARQRHRLHDRRSTSCSASRPARPCAPAAASSRAAGA